MYQCHLVSSADAAGTVADDPGRRGIEQWLSQTGYPLEFFTAEALKGLGFIVEAGVQFEASSTKKIRETDIVASEPRVQKDDEVLVVVECKYSDRPWIVRADRSAPEIDERLELLRMDGRTRKALKRHVENEDPIPFIVGFGDLIGHGVSEGPGQGGEITKATLRDRDKPFEALQSVVDALESRVGRKSIYDGPWFGLPVIVLDAELWLVIADASGVPTPTRRKWQRVKWRAHPGSQLTAIDIVTKDNLETYAHELRADTMWVAGVMKRLPPERFSMVG